MNEKRVLPDIIRARKDKVHIDAFIERQNEENVSTSTQIPLSLLNGTMRPEDQAAYYQEFDTRIITCIDRREQAATIGFPGGTLGMKKLLAICLLIQKMKNKEDISTIKSEKLEEEIQRLFDKYQLPLTSHDCQESFVDEKGHFICGCGAITTMLNDLGAILHTSHTGKISPENLSTIQKVLKNMFDSSLTQIDTGEHKTEKLTDGQYADIGHHEIRGVVENNTDTLFTREGVYYIFDRDTINRYLYEMGKCIDLHKPEIKPVLDAVIQSTLKRLKLAGKPFIILKNGTEDSRGNTSVESAVAGYLREDGSVSMLNSPRFRKYEPAQRAQQSPTPVSPHQG
jgi:hypothetical protein